MVIGVISDTHGLLRPQACAALSGADMILHAGDIGRVEVLQELGKIAPVIAVRGNNDRAAWAEPIPWNATVELAGSRIFILHILADLNFDPAACGLAVVISGHSHRPRLERRGGVLYLNPGSAGPRRFKLPVTVALFYPGEAEVRSEIVELAVA